MYTLSNATFSYSMDEKGRCASVVLNGFESQLEPTAIWKLIYAVPGTERVEAVIWADDQQPCITQGDNQITIHYASLIGDRGNRIDASLTVFVKLTDEGIRANARLENRDATVELMELQLTPVSGLRSLSGDPENDYIAWPRSMGRKVRNPAFRDLSTYAGFRKYERHDQFHTDMDALYQQDRGCMLWYDWYNKDMGLFVSCEDLSRDSICLHVERDTKKNLLRFGFIHYPMMKAGETYESPVIVCYLHQGDWHQGAKLYRRWMDQTGSFVPPVLPDWCRDFTGWLRVILKQHHCECNWTFDDIPALYDECEAEGFKTLYLLGWETGGFARCWPDFEIDEGILGGKAKLKAGIDYIHQKGGRVMMFLSHLLIHHKSKFYLEQGGDKATVRSLWDEDVPFSETYCGEGTYRKIGNPPMPMFLSCPESLIWHEKMKDAARVCLDAGADGVLYDLGGIAPYFCYANDHGHDKPSHAYRHKADRFQDLRRLVKTYGDDKMISMEHNVDLFGQHMDIVHSGGAQPEKRLWKPETATNDGRDDEILHEMYRYTFPELVLTNRECGEDEEHYKAFAGYSFVMGLRFDMTIFRCCGSLKDIPNYAAYLKELNALYQKHKKHLLKGRFVDTDGFETDNAHVVAKGYRAEDGSIAVAMWNPTGVEQKVTIVRDGESMTVMVAAEGVAVC